ncbi:cell division protein FtsQ/DivIB [Arthrobacter sp. NPDC056727]|uniref:cell division protein FtsQ/DivIB n=1 Tax=Arthrobacter sp. NPDC056727 TaxID=3345927 RepID=UPI0036705C5B
MASTRRPTYRPAKPAARNTDGAREAGAALDAEVRDAGVRDAGGSRAGGARPDGGKPAVITASKVVPESPASKGKAQDKQAKAPWSRLKSPEAGKPGTKSKKPAPVGEEVPAGTGPDNVLAFPEPRGRRIRRNIIVAACVTAAIVAGLIAAAVYSPVLAVHSVSVTGTKLLKPAQVQAALKPLLGTPLPQVSESQIDSLLKPLVQIKSVRTQAHPPSVLVVQVQERVPVALVKRGNEYLLVDVDGVKLGTTADPASVKLPVIDGGAGTIGKDLFQATAEVLGALPANVLAKLSNASAKSVDAVELKLLDGQTVIWGNAGEKELKARVLEALLKVPADPANPVNTYDVSVPRHPVTR